MIRFILLQSILAALLIAMRIMGWLDEPFLGPIAPAIWTLCSLMVLGLVALACGNERWPRWLAPRMPAFALVGTGLGFVVALRHAGVDQAAALEGAAIAIYSMVTGVIGWLWLSLCLMVVRGQSEDE